MDVKCGDQQVPWIIAQLQHPLSRLMVPNPYMYARTEWCQLRERGKNCKCDRSNGRIDRVIVSICHAERTPSGQLENRPLHSGGKMNLAHLSARSASRRVDVSKHVRKRIFWNTVIVCCLLPVPVQTL
ncbi:hypothetical protein M514_01350 [Trichuris suis]|uniref:Uncharacterized protein n=1 Tax=Trichuris suis TaxID=68888 RepID=A0A085MKD4_9BILA|nr:hypothetical protein M513_01350 [Trichuris suis]KFD72236.1 hypothetical protein M514_01350 [Trichuris suis]